MTGPADGTDPVTVSELAVLGSAVKTLDDARDAIAARLEPRHFSTEARRAVFAAVTRLATAPAPVVDPTSVIAELAARRPLDENDPDPAAVVAALVRAAGPVGHHAGKVRAAWQQRNMRRAIGDAAELAGGAGWDPATTPARIRELIGDAASVTGASRLSEPAEILDEVLGSLEHGVNPAISTGYADLDDLINGGLMPGTLTVIAARPAVGKTLAAMCMADYIATDLELPVLYTSLEMTKRLLTLRRIASAAQVPLRKLTRWEADEADWDKIGKAYPGLVSNQLRIDDTPAGLPQIRGRLHEMAAEGTPARVHFLDYLGITPAPANPNREQQVAGLVKGYREIARELDIPVVALAQINRSPEGRKDKTPQLSDLRESGAIENDADLVLLLHRDDPQARHGELRVIVAKHRMGETGEVILTFQGHYGRIAGRRPGEWDPAGAAG
jgi:replicative DNA helicase